MYSKKFILFVFCFLLLINKITFSQEFRNPKWKKYTEFEEKKEILNPQSNIICLIDINTIKHSANHKVKTLRKLDNRTIIASIERDDYLALKKLNTSIRRVNNKWKLSDNLVNIKNNFDGTIILKSTNTVKIIDQIKLNSHYKIVFTHKNLIAINGNISRIIDDFIDNPDVNYIGMESSGIVSENTISELDHSFNRIQKSHLAFPELNGEGATVSIKDIGMFNKNDIDLLGKFINSELAPKNISNHATSMATIIAGLGNYSKGKGV